MLERSRGFLAASPVSCCSSAAGGAGGCRPRLQKAFYFRILGGCGNPASFFFPALCTICLTKWLSPEPKRLPDNLRKLSLTRSCSHLKNSGMFWVFHISPLLGFCSRRFLLCNDSLGSGWFSHEKGDLFCVRWVYPGRGGGRRRGGAGLGCLLHARLQHG